MEKRISIAVLILTVFLIPPGAIRANEKEPKPGSFEEKTGHVFEFFLFTAMEIGVVPGFESLPLMATTADHPGEEIGPEQARELKRYAANLRSFPDDLLKALISKDRKLQSSAMESFAEYPLMVRAFAQLREDFGKDLFAVALGRFAKPIQNSLEIVLKSGEPMDRLMSAAVLLELDPDHAPALAAMVAALKNGNATLRRKACEMAGGLVLSQAEVVAGVVEAVTNQDIDVRRAAAHAVSKIGPKAKKAAPGLIELLKSGKAANKDVRLKYTIILKQIRNVALLALGSLAAR